jgi:hypothetical protein
LWFSLGSLLHTLIDIPTHAGDGPLLFFPFDWQTRFNSPLSYWDPNFYGLQFMVFEILLTVGLLAYLFLPKLLQEKYQVVTRHFFSKMVEQPLATPPSCIFQ